MRGGQNRRRGGRAGDSDPAPAPPLPDGLLPHVTSLTPNESEAERLTGITVSDETSARGAAAQLLAAGANYAIVTLAPAALLAGPDRTI